MSTWLQNVGKTIDTVGKKFGNPLPEFGISERLVGKAYASEPQVAGAQTFNPSINLVSTNPNINPYAGGAIRNTPTPTNTGGGMPSNPVPQDNNQQFNNINNQLNDANAQIDADYNSAMNMLSGAEQGLQGNAANATSQINNDIAAGRTELGSAQTTQEQGVQSSLKTGETNATTQMQQARDLFRQTQQQNNAQLSALGISSSSVAEALAERLGVETARRIAGVTGALAEVRQNAVNELGRIGKYYTEKKTQLEEQGRIQREQIQQALIQGLNTINAARGQAASDKAQARSNLLSQVNQQIYALTAQQQQFDQALKQWATQKSAALAPIKDDPNYLQTLFATAQTMNQQFKPTGFTALPQVNYGQNGQISGQIGWQKTPQVDEYGNPVNQNGIPTPNFQ